MSEDAHARPTRDAPEPLYDLNIPTPTHAERARTLVGRVSTGTLCTLALEPEGYPYGSFVTVAFDNGNSMAVGRDPELEVLVQRVEVTDDRDAALVALVEEVDGLTVADAAQTPYLLVGSAEEMVDQRRRQAERQGITRCVVRQDAVSALAPLLPSLA